MHEASRKTTNVTVFSCLAISVRRGMNESGNILMLSVCFRTALSAAAKQQQSRPVLLPSNLHSLPHSPSLSPYGNFTFMLPKDDDAQHGPSVSRLTPVMRTSFVQNILESQERERERREMGRAHEERSAAYCRARSRSARHQPQNLAGRKSRCSARPHPVDVCLPL